MKKTLLFGGKIIVVGLNVIKFIVFRLIEGKQKRYFKDEIKKEVKHDKVGLLCMANLAPNQNASEVINSEN
jgi:cyclophilin family peptidyl-prolyl cis-trans isomerase